MESDRQNQNLIPRGIRPDKSAGNTRGAGEFLSSYCNRIRTNLDYLADKSQVSFRWYTHTNPAGCWICDTFTAAYALLRELQNLAEQLESPTRETAEGGVLDESLARSGESFECGSDDVPRGEDTEDMMES